MYFNKKRAAHIYQIKAISNSIKAIKVVKIVENREQTTKEVAHTK